MIPPKSDVSDVSVRDDNLDCGTRFILTRKDGHIYSTNTEQFIVRGIEMAYLSNCSRTDITT